MRDVSDAVKWGGHPKKSPHPVPNSNCRFLVPSCPGSSALYATPKSVRTTRPSLEMRKFEGDRSLCAMLELSRQATAAHICLIRCFAARVNVMSSGLGTKVASSNTSCNVVG